MLKEKAIEYNSKFHFNVLPLIGKVPSGNWQMWQSKPQSDGDIRILNWKSATGIGLVSGVADLRILDFDNMSGFDILPDLLKVLDLDEHYPWITISGSGRGLHILFRAKESELLKKEFGDKGVFAFPFKDENLCHHLELRWRGCQTAAPPSTHPDTSNCYQFYEVTEIPDTPPEYLDASKVISLIKKFCRTGEVREKIEKPDDTNNLVYYDNKSLESALDYLSKNLSKGSYDDWFKIGMALVPLGLIGENYFVKMSLANKNYTDTEKALRVKFRGMMRDSRGAVSLGSLYHIAELRGWKKPIIKFWKSTKTSLTIELTKLKRFLASEGFCKFKIDKNPVFARITENLVEEVTITDIKDFVIQYINCIPLISLEDLDPTRLMDALIKNSSKIFCVQFMEFLPTKKIDFIRDSKDESILFYRNGVLLVTKDERILISYKEFGKFIWKTQILDREFCEVSERSVFDEFIFKIVRNDPNRYLALKSSIGYLLHRYKDPTNARAVFYVDEKLSDGAFGRSGKGLVLKAVLKLREGVTQDGRNFSMSKNFAFQRVVASTNVIALEDIGKNFPFEKLFSCITDGIAVEKKNQNEFYLEYNVAPKFGITSNFTVRGLDDSTQDRQFIVEFSDHYNKNHRPVDDFGTKFFDGWSKEEWYAFDCFMADSLQLFLRDGLIPYQFINLELKMITDSTSPEFIEFIEDESNFTPDTTHDKKDLFKNFVDTYPDFSKLTQRKFTSWIKAWGRIKGYRVEEGKSGSERTITLYKLKSAS
ncbi:MAG: bifunctional DNA primase/polymerase [Ignavibacteriaceae bacterium]